MSGELPKVGQLYRHFKGGIYEVIALAKHSETLEDIVVYKKFGQGCHMWVRPLSDWMSLKDGKVRFELYDLPR